LSEQALSHVAHHDDKLVRSTDDADLDGSGVIAIGVTYHVGERFVNAERDVAHDLPVGPLADGDTGDSPAQ